MRFSSSSLALSCWNSCSHSSCHAANLSLISLPIFYSSSDCPVANAFEPVISWLQVLIQIRIPSLNSKLSCRACFSLANHFSAVPKFPHQHLNLSTVEDRQTNRAALHIKNENSFFLIGEQLKIYIDLQLIDQPHTGALRLFKGTTSHHTAGPFIGDTKHQLATAIIRQSAAAPCRFSKVKPILGFFELDVFAFLCF